MKTSDSASSISILSLYKPGYSQFAKHSLNSLVEAKVNVIVFSKRKPL